MKTLLRCWLVVFACLCGGMSGAMAGQDDGVFGGFFSYLPAPPHLELPRINLVPFWTDDLKRGRDSYVNGDYRSALDAFQKSSDDGNTIADWYLGTMYRLGRGVSINNAVAYSYYSRVAENFDPDEPDRNRLRVIIDAQLRMADYQRTGIKGANLKANPQLAYRTYQRLATSYGHPGALYALGVMNIEGEGLKKNPQQGLKWLNAAVRKRSPDAAAYLAELYKRGDIVRQDACVDVVYDCGGLYARKR